MKEIICPNCKKAFKIDEAGYAEILKQVRDNDFEKQLHERLEIAEREKQSAIELAKEKTSNELQQKSAEKDAEIQRLNTQIEANEVSQKLAITEAISSIEKERDELKNNLEKTLLAGGFDLTTAEGAASIVVGGTKLYEEVPGLMDSIEYGFDTLATLTGGAIIHRGIYEDSSKENLVAYTIVGGLDIPQKRLDELKKFLRIR